MAIVNATQRIASNVRAQLGRKQRSGANVAKSLQKSQAWMQRRLSGQVPFDVAELEMVAAELGVPLSDLISDDERASA